MLRCYMKSQQYHRIDGVFRNRLMCILLTIWIRSHTSVRQWVSFKRFMKNILLNYKLFGLIDEKKKFIRVDGNGRSTTMATSGRAHDTAEVSPDGEKRAMLVCRVVAGSVKTLHSSKSSEDHDCDSVSPCSEGVYSDLDELFVFSPRAILPCFVVIYSGY